jgi:hypothetical protein
MLRVTSIPLGVVKRNLRMMNTGRAWNDSSG